MQNSSTPLSQLPIPPVQDSSSTYVNDQQKQYIAQAQNAISNNAVGIPQNTKFSSDIADDDSVAQEILNQINAEASVSPTPPIYQPQQYYPMQQQPVIQPQTIPVVIPSAPASILLHFMGDLKLAGLVFVTVVLVHFLPVESTLSKYIALDKIPYHRVILNAILVALLVVAIKKLVPM